MPNVNATGPYTHPSTHGSFGSKQIPHILRHCCCEGGAACDSDADTAAKVIIFPVRLQSIDRNIILMVRVFDTHTHTHAQTNTRRIIHQRCVAGSVYMLSCAGELIFICVSFCWATDVGMCVCVSECSSVSRFGRSVVFNANIANNADIAVYIMAKLSRECRFLWCMHAAGLHAIVGSSTFRLCVRACVFRARKPDTTRAAERHRHPPMSACGLCVRAMR